jgi:glutamyl/glutaminyl-tRNA synthetase
MKKPNVDLSALKERLSRPLNNVIRETNEKDLELQQSENKQIFDSLEKIKENLKEVLYALEEISESDFTENKIKEILMKIADGKESRGEVLHPIRYALSGLDRSPDPFIIASILGKDETISRLQKAIE